MTNIDADKLTLNGIEYVRADKAAQPVPNGKGAEVFRLPVGDSWGL